jgi:hypothetical protein
MLELDEKYQRNMTLHALAEAFRANNISIGEPSLGRHIIAGNLPFACGVVGEHGKGTHYIISRNGAYEWIKQFTGKEPVRVTIT